MEERKYNLVTGLVDKFTLIAVIVVHLFHAIFCFVPEDSFKEVEKFLCRFESTPYHF